MQQYCHFNYEERVKIQLLAKEGYTLRKIASMLGRSPSSVSREIKRNKGKRGYRPSQASRSCHHRKHRKAHKMNGDLKEKVLDKLRLQWSPEQISGRLKKEGRSISHETIYRYLWRNKARGGTLHHHLRHRGKKYCLRKHRVRRRGIIPGRIDIDFRPDIVEQKRRIGDWELDTIVGAGHKGAIVSMVDRASKMVRLVKLEHNRASCVRSAIVSRLSCEEVETLTSDNGKEFAQHQAIASALKASFYFAKPYQAWQRGLNEHSNGLVRQYIPKKMLLSTVSDRMLARIEFLLNNRPRAVLHFRTPQEVYSEACSNPQSVALGC